MACRLLYGMLRIVKYVLVQYSHVSVTAVGMRTVI